MVESHLIQMARTGQLMGKVSLLYNVLYFILFRSLISCIKFDEDHLINLLEKVSEQTQKKTVVNVIEPFYLNYHYCNLSKMIVHLKKYDRRRTAIDSDDD